MQHFHFHLFFYISDSAMKLSVGRLCTLRARPFPCLLYILFSYHLAVSLYLWGSAPQQAVSLGLKDLHGWRRPVPISGNYIQNHSGLMDRLRMKFCSSNPQYYNQNFSVCTGDKFIVFPGTSAARVLVERTRDCSLRWMTGESEIKLGQNARKYKIQFRRNSKCPPIITT